MSIFLNASSRIRTSAMSAATIKLGAEVKVIRMRFLSTLFLFLKMITVFHHQSNERVKNGFHVSAGTCENNVSCGKDQESVLWFFLSFFHDKVLVVFVVYLTAHNLVGGFRTLDGQHLTICGRYRNFDVHSRVH